MKRWLGGALALLLLGCTATLPTARLGSQGALLQVGKTAPVLEGLDADGKIVRLSDLRGKVVLIDFWQTN